MSLRDALLPAIQAIRSIPVDLGLRRYEVWLRKVVWSGDRVSIGNATSTDTYLGRPKVREVRSRDVVLGSAMNETLLELGPFTPETYAALPIASTPAVSPSDLSPAQTARPTEVHYLIKGPGLPDDGALFARVSDGTDRPFRYVVTVKAVGIEV